MSACVSPITPSLFATHAGRGGPWRIIVATLIALAAIPAGTGAAHGARSEIPCAAGNFCTWSEANFAGTAHETSVRVDVLEQCVRLPQETEVKSFANNTGHAVTVYQDPYCDTEADFSTHPTGSQMPQPTYVARAIKIWAHR